jgi:ribosome-associated heat shock protein Hsp15
LADPAPPRLTIRLDKWLWHARFFKTRSLATREVQAGHVRVNGQRVTKPATTVGQGDALTFAQGDHIRVVRVLAPGDRRGPAPEAQALYDDLSPPPRPGEPKPAPTTAPGFDGNKFGGGRPSKKDRRILDRSQDRQQGQGDDSTA